MGIYANSPVYELNLPPNLPDKIDFGPLRIFSDLLSKSERFRFFGATIEYRATSVHLVYMCRHVLKNEALHNRFYSYAMRCK